MAASIIGACAVRVSRLLDNGTPDYGNSEGAFAFCGGISKFEHDFEIEKGDNVFERDACGKPVVIRKYPDTVTQATFTLTMAKSDYRLNEILGISTLLEDGGDPVGHAVLAGGGCDTSDPTKVAIELWSELWDCDVAADPPYMRAILPLCYLTPKGYTREGKVSLPVFEGFAQSNANFDDGPFGDLDMLTGVTGWCYAEVDDDGLPTCPDPLDYIALPSGSS